MDKTFILKIVAPGKPVETLEIQSFTTKTNDGEIEINKDHAPIVASIVPTISVINHEGIREKIFTSYGMLYIEDNVLYICCDTFERENDIDLSRAQRAKERAEERLKNKSSIDIDRANKALERAKARLRINN